MAVDTWTSEGPEKWSRNIPGLDGTLCGVQTSTTEPVLQLHDLQGNIVATASLSEGATELASKYNSTEFGVPSEGKAPPKYAWLGASGLSTETAFGSGVSTQGGASYVPQVARDLQTAPPVPPGAFPNGQGTGEQYGSEIPGWYISLSEQESAATLAAWTAKQEQLKREAEVRCREEGGCREFIDPECYIKIRVVASYSSTGKEWVNARGWSWCSGIHTLPKFSQLEVCLVGEYISEGAEVPPLENCKIDGSGWNFEKKEGAPFVGTLYKQAHMPCLSEVAYWGWVWVWIPGMKEGKEMWSKHPWECHQSAGETFFGFLVSAIELMTGPSPK